MVELDGLTRNAETAMRRVTAQLDTLGLRHVQLAPFMMGVGVGIAWSDTDFVVLSTTAAEDVPWVEVTAGVLKDVSRADRPLLLEACNSLTRDNPAFPIFLHDAESGWDLLTQHRLLIDLVEREPGYFKLIVEAVPMVANQRRAELGEREINGQAHRWNSDQLQQLLIRSLM